MKTKLVSVTSAIYAASLLISSAASYTLQTGSTAAASGFGNLSGVAFQNSANASFAGPGTVGFGFFTISDAAIMAATTADALIGSFQPFGLTPTGTFTAPGLSANRGTFSRNSTGVVAGSNFANAFMYVFVGNGTTYAGSSEFAVVKTPFQFLAADDPTPTPIVNTLTSANGTILFGSASANILTTGTDSTTTPGFSTALIIPEPSSAVIGALGAFGLLRRRRN